MTESVYTRDSVRMCMCVWTGKLFETREQLHGAIVSTALPKNAKRTVAAFIWNDEYLDDK